MDHTQSKKNKNRSYIFIYMQFSIDHNAVVCNIHICMENIQIHSRIDWKKKIFWNGWNIQFRKQISFQMMMMMMMIIRPTIEFSNQKNKNKQIDRVKMMKMKKNWQKHLNAHTHTHIPENRISMSLEMKF